MVRVTFLMAAHNEEKIIRGALENLSKLPYDSYEVILGLDGCEDKTLEIVQEYKKKQPKIFHYFELNERKGKPAVVNKIIPHAKGDIIIIHDADWIFKVRGEKDMDEMVAWFDRDPKLGGIVESYPIEYEPYLLQGSKDWAFISAGWGSYFWLDFMKKKFTIRKDGGLYVDNRSKNLPFLCNIFRTKLYSHNETLADDFERPLDIMKNGYKLRVLESPQQPRMIAGYNYQSFKDLKKQKTRTALARDQLFSKYDLHVTATNFYIPLFWHAITRMWGKGGKAIIATSTWLFFTSYGALKNKLTVKKQGTKEGWLMRAQRQ